MKFVDRLKQSFVGISTATITLGGAVSGFRTVAQAIADGDAAIGDEIPMGVREGATWELSLFKVDTPTQLSRVRVLASWSGGTEATFPAGMHEIACTQPAEYLNGQDIAAVAALTSVADAVRILCIDTAGELRTVTAGVLKAYNGGATPPADTTKPSAPTNVGSTSVTQTGYTVTFTPGTDNIALARTEWSLNGSTWNTVGGGAAGNSFAVSGRTAGSTDNVQLRSVDTSGNTSTAVTLPVVLQPATGNQAPALSGSISKTNITTSGFTFSWTAATDVDGNGDRVETSIDGGTSWMQHAFNATTRTVATGAGDYAVRIRAIDSAGLISNVLVDTVTVPAAATAPAAPTIGTMTAGDGSVSQAFTTGSNGGSPITGFTLTVYRVSDNSIVTTATGASSPISAAVTNGIAVYGKVKATNAVNTGPESAASNSVIPAGVVAYTVTGYSGNAIKPTIDASAIAANGGLKLISPSSTNQMTVGIYWNVKRTADSVDAASAKSGWVPAGTIPNASNEITQGQNSNNAASINGLTPMGKAAAFSNQAFLVVPAGSGTTSWDHYIKPVDGGYIKTGTTTVTGA